ncbi:heat shock protein 33 [Legionella geestiana]|uniref:Heat shock protein 33 n=1 Tax=Legionella geestiana TaxID=45065 RepID=A0A0W0TLG9_9GAMM|nr:Hsp33 family molecular chaperone HslO [Legionella geestiana]KTC96450.1 heat shock protein 33 [Legionella geestiana]QBS12496.1 Hsp33 family molecular chaperone HslO [Legionella geestiana]QDQ39790.1 Hsp33 family molecular chaperone HslO [Legionella geestiana]STX55061.1 heat shock protein 33 [Legionella geestiana]
MDNLQTFVFEHAPVRGAIVRLQDTFMTVIEQRDYPPKVRELLAEAMLSCLLLASSIKFEGDLILQFKGDAALPQLLVQCDHQLHLRAHARFDKEASDADYSRAFQSGTLILAINQHQQTETYQSMVPLNSASMAENLMQYFAQSEQIPTKVWLAVGKDRAAGMLLQMLPGGDSSAREHFWEYAVVLGDTVKDEELLQLDNIQLLHRLYHETDVRLFEARDVQFRCRCSREKMQQALRILGQEEANALLKERGDISMCCEFCNREYRLDSIDVAMVFTS